MRTGSKILIQRLRDNGRATLGKLSIWDEHEVVFECVTIEPTWLFNMKNISCIPVQPYEVVRHQSPNFGDSLLVKDVPGRSSILFHSGNFYQDTKGCIIPGLEFADLDGDGKLDVTNSKMALRNIMDHLAFEEGIELVIVRDPQFQTVFGGSQ